MFRLLLFFPLLFLLIAGGIYYEWYSPSMIKKHATEHALQHMADIVNAHDRAAIGTALQGFLAEPAAINLEVGFFSLAHPDNADVVKQQFSRSDFMSFIDNILFSLSDYKLHASLEQFDLHADKQSAAVTFKAEAEGEGLSYYGGVGMHMHFVADSDCSGEVALQMPTPVFTVLNCHVQLHSLPNGDDANKLQNPEALRDFLR